MSTQVTQSRPTHWRGDFTRFPDSTTLPAGYFRTRYSSAGAGVVVLNNALRLTSGTVSDFTGGIRLTLRPSQGVTDNFTLYARGKVISTGLGVTYFPAFMFRATPTESVGVNPERGYILGLGASGVSLSRTIFGVPATVNGGNGVSGGTFTTSLAVGDIFHARLAVRGDHMMVRCWRGGESEPTNWPGRGLDTAIPRKGEMQVAQGRGSSNGVVEFQEITIDRLPLPVNKVNSDVTGMVYRYTVASPTIPASIAGNVAVFNAATQSQTPTLPHPSLLAGLPVVVKREQADASANTVTLGVPAGVTIDGAATLALTRGDALILSPDGANSYLITGVYT